MSLPALLDADPPKFIVAAERDFASSALPEPGTWKPEVSCASLPGLLSSGVKTFKLKAVPKLSPMSSALLRRKEAMRAIDRCVEDSKYILSLEDDWDGESSPGYRPSTWKRAVGFLEAHAKHIWDVFKRRIPVPDIVPSVDGRIDLHWKNAVFEMLVCVPPKGLVEFYADDLKREFYTKGRINAYDVSQAIVEWLLRGGA